MKKILILGLASIVLSGCSAKNNLYFGTSTSVGLDVVGTPASPISASFAYKRAEVTFSEQKKGQEPYSVLGTLDMDVDFWAGTKVDQHFATGAASEVAAYQGLLNAQGQGNAILTDTEKTEKKDKIKALINDPSGSTGNAACTQDSTDTSKDQKFLFVTGSTIGIDIDASKADPHVVIGYKRLESAYVPVCKTDGKVGSVYSRMQFDSQSDNVSKFFTNTGIKQSFATGTAAKILALNSTLGTDAAKAILQKNPEQEIAPPKK